MQRGPWASLWRLLTVERDVPAERVVVPLLLLVEACSRSSEVFVHGQRVVGGRLRGQALEQEVLKGQIPAAGLGKAGLQPWTFVALHFLLKIVTGRKVGRLKVVRIPSGHRVLLV